MCVKNREAKHQNKEDTRKPRRDGSEHGGGLGAENIFRHTPAESRAKPLALRTLHQNDKHHEESDDGLNHEQ